MNPEISKTRALEAITEDAFDFTAKYLALHELQDLARTSPEVMDAGAVAVVAGVFDHPDLAVRRRGYFMYRMAAETLCAMLVHADQTPAADPALSVLRELLARPFGWAHRAAAESVGSLPVSVQGFSPAAKACPDPPRLRFSDLLDQFSLKTNGTPGFQGRSLVAGLEGGRLLVIKLARAVDDPELLSAECQWMELLSESDFPDARFRVPTPLFPNGGTLFRLSRFPRGCAVPGGLHASRFAVAFIAPGDYFSYPNHTIGRAHPDADAFLDAMNRNARILGRLTGRGIIHDAPIPLFHNRVQQDRRRDRGRYEWFRAGRLDRWLESCAYPNIGMSGVRDFEHLVPAPGGGLPLYRHIGTHLLSLLLVAGSYFRNKREDRRGFSETGEPVDTRNLFDADLLEKAVSGILHGYLSGFTGNGGSAPLPVDIPKLVERMIEEMGVDRHMEEILRQTDQDRMTDEAFQCFLMDRGFSRKEAAAMQKGAADLAIHTGPHLGGFNEQISLPEIIHATHVAAAHSILNRFLAERSRPAGTPPRPVSVKKIKST